MSIITARARAQVSAPSQSILHSCPQGAFAPDLVMGSQISHPPPPPHTHSVARLLGTVPSHLSHRWPSERPMKRV